MPCQFVPVNRASMISITSIVPSGLTVTWSSKFPITSCRCAIRGQAAASATRKIASTGRLDGIETIPLRRAAEAHLGNLALGWCADLEELARLEVEHARENIGRELRDFCIEVAHDGIVVAPGILEAVFDLTERGLELREAFTGAELRVGLGQSKHLAQRRAERALGPGLLRRS